MPSGVGRLFGRYISVGNEIYQVPIKIYHWRLLSCKVLVIFGAKLGWVSISNMQLQAEMVEVFSWMQKDTESTVITKRLICRAVFYEAIEAGIREHRYLLHYTIDWKILDLTWRTWGNMVYSSVEEIWVYLPILFFTNSFRPQLLIEQCYNRAHENSSSQYVWANLC